MGTWMLGEHLSIYQQEKKALQAGLDAGFTLIDTAEMYGNGLSEKLIGDTIQGYSREKLFLVSKVYPHNAGRPQIYDSIDQTLHNLKTDYLDMYLIHWPFAAAGFFKETWRALLKLRDEGAVRVPGVSNFLPQHLRALIEDSGETPAVNQIEVHPRFNQPGNRAFCAANGVAVEAYSPLGHGKDIESEPVVAAAKAHDVTPAQVVLRWHTQEGRIIIPKSKHVERMRVNLASSDFDLTSAELAAIDALDDPHDNVSADPATFMHSQSWADQHVRGNI